MLLDRLAGEVEVERAVQIISSGAEPLRELIGAMHSKLLLAELRRQRGDRGSEPRDARCQRVASSSGGRSPPDVVVLHHAVALGQLGRPPSSPLKVPNGWR